MLNSLVQHSPILVTVAPLVGGALCLLFGNRLLAYAIALLSTLFALIASFHLLLIARGGTVISYHLGGWAPPLGIEYRIDAANAFVLVIVALLGFITLPYCRATIEKDIGQNQHGLFYTCYLMCITGLLGVTITGDAFNVFVFLEISSLATYVLVAMGAKRDKRALSAAYDYLILGTIGATFFVIGLGLIYMVTGTLNMADLAERLVDKEDNRTVRSAFAFIVVGLGLKVAVFPLHRWLPNAYAYAPSAISTLLAATSTKVAMYVMIRFLFSVFTIEFLFARETLVFVVLPLGLVAMFVASTIAIFQINIKRLLAYSSIAQIGYMLVGIALINTSGLSSTLVHLFNHAVSKAALFMALGAVVLRFGSPMIHQLQGLGKTMPLTGAAIVIGGLSLIGVPGTVGFVSKYELISAALQKGWWPISLLVVLSSILAVAYVWKLVETMYLQAPPAGVERKEAGLGVLAPMGVLIVAIVYFGINAEFTLGTSRMAAESLFAADGAANAVRVMGLEGR